MPMLLGRAGSTCATPSTIMNLSQGPRGLYLDRRPGRQALGHTGGLC
jgi:hypothetical protein